MGKPKKVGLAAGVLGCALLGLVLANRQTDAQSAAQLVGTWQAIDPSNAALHNKKDPVESEQLVVQPDGSLVYTVRMKNPSEAPAADHWGWKVEKGRLRVQFRTEGSTDAWMPPIRFAVSNSSLSINRKGFPAKEFSRVKG